MLERESTYYRKQSLRENKNWVSNIFGLEHNISHLNIHSAFDCNLSKASNWFIIVEWPLNNNFDEAHAILEELSLF